jgi:hypothetical protein
MPEMEPLRVEVTPEVEQGGLGKKPGKLGGR